MKSCAIGSSIGGVAMAVVLAIGACHSTPPPGDIPPVTSARASDSIPISSDGPKDAAVAEAAAATTAPPLASPPPPPKVAIHDAPFKIDEGVCDRVIVAVATGKFTVAGETLAAGDAIVLFHAEGNEVKGTGFAVEARVPIAGPCAILDRPVQEKTVVRANAAPKLEWAGGKMNAHLDVGTKLSPDLYLGRIEGTMPVAEHVHAGSWEVLVAVEAAGTFTLDGREQRLGPRQIVWVPPNTKHSFRPDPGASKLVAVQMYSPPGPEQRFVGLAAAEKDGGKP